MPLNVNTLNNELNVIFRTGSFNAISNMIEPSSISDSVKENNKKISKNFTKGFEDISHQISSAFNSTVISGLVSTSNGSAPPNPLQVSKLGNDIRKNFRDNLGRAMNDSLNLKINKNNQTIMNHFANEFVKKLSTFNRVFGNNLASSLKSSGFITVSANSITSEIGKHFEKYFESSFKALEVSISENNIDDINKRIKVIFSEEFKKISNPLSKSFVKILKSGVVKITLGVGSIS